MALLEIDNLTVDFPTRRVILRALDGISLSTDDREVLIIVGKSGACK